MDRIPSATSAKPSSIISTRISKDSEISYLPSQGKKRKWRRRGLSQQGHSWDWWLAAVSDWLPRHGQDRIIKKIFSSLNNIISSKMKLILTLLFISANAGESFFCIHFNICGSHSLHLLCLLSLMMLSSRAVAIAGPPPSKDVVDQFLDCVEDQGWDTKACLTSYGYDLSTFTCDSKAVCQDLVRCGYFDEDTWLGCLTVPMDPCLEKCDETLSIQ